MDLKKFIHELIDIMRTDTNVLNDPINSEEENELRSPEKSENGETAGN